MKDKANLGISLLNQKKFTEANKIFSALVLEYSSHFYPRYLLGLLKSETEDYSEALENLLSSLKLNEKHIPTYVDLSYVYTKLGEYKKTEDIITKGLSLESNNLPLRLNLSFAFLVQGKTKELIKNDNEILKIDKKNYYVIRRLHELKQPVLNKKLKSSIKNSLNKKNLKFEDKINANFLLARFENEINKVGSEYEFLMRAHEIIFTHNKIFFESNNDLIFSKLSKIYERFTSSTDFNISEPKNNKLKPIFIFGLPRSGSTLLEKIMLNSSTEIVAGEETRFFNEIVDTLFFNKFDGDITKCLLEINRKYLNLINTANSNIVFTDKSLNNFFFLGWIKQVFPNATFINCNRDPFTIMSSILRNNLSRLTWAHRLDDVVKYIDVYHNVLNKWEEILDIEIYQFSYSRLIQDFNTETKKLFKFCDLDWHEDLANFNKLKFISQTASNIKIRDGFLTDEEKKHLAMSDFLRKKVKNPNWNLNI